MLESTDTARLRLRPVSHADLPALLLVNGDAEVTRFLPYRAWRGMDDAEAWLERMNGRVAGGDTHQFVIEHRGLRQVIGSCLVFRIDAVSARAELGYVLGRAHWGQGLMAEAMDAFVGLCFRQLGLNRLEADIDPDNEASAKLLDRLGFSREGLLRERYRNEAGPVDAALYGLLRREWARG